MVQKLTFMLLHHMQRNVAAAGYVDPKLMNRKCVQCMTGEIFFIVSNAGPLERKKDHSADQVTQ